MSLLDYHFFNSYLIVIFKFLLPPYSHFFHPTRLAKFLPYLFICAYFFMKFAQNIHPTRLFGPTHLIGTWE